MADDPDDDNAIDPESDTGDDQGTDTIVALTSEVAAVPDSSSGDAACIASGMTAWWQRSCILNTSPSITTRGCYNG